MTETGWFITIVVFQGLVCWAWHHHYPLFWWRQLWWTGLQYLGQFGQWWMLHHVSGHLYYKYKGTLLHLPDEYSKVDLHGWGYIRYRRWWRLKAYPFLVRCSPDWGYYTTFMVWVPHYFCDLGQQLSFASLYRLHLSALRWRYHPSEATFLGVSPIDTAAGNVGIQIGNTQNLEDRNWLVLDPAFYHPEIEPFQEPALDRFDNQQDEATDEESDWTIVGDLEYGVQNGQDRSREYGQPRGLPRFHRRAISRYNRKILNQNGDVSVLNVNRRDIAAFDDPTHRRWDIYNLVEAGDGPNVVDLDEEQDVVIDLWKHHLLDWFFLTARTRSLTELPTLGTRYTHLLLNTKRSNPRQPLDVDRQYRRRIGLLKWMFRKKMPRFRRQHPVWMLPARPPEAKNGYGLRPRFLWFRAGRTGRILQPTQTSWFTPMGLHLQNEHHHSLRRRRQRHYRVTTGWFHYSVRRRKWRHLRVRRFRMNRFHAPRYRPAYTTLMHQELPGIAQLSGDIRPSLPRPGLLMVAIGLYLLVVTVDWYNGLGTGVYQHHPKLDWIAHQHSWSEWWALKVEPPQSWFNYYRARSIPLFITYGNAWRGIDANLAQTWYHADYLAPRSHMLEFYHESVEYSHFFHHGALQEHGRLAPFFFYKGESIMPFHSSWIWWYGNTNPRRMSRGIDYSLTNPSWWSIRPSETTPEPYKLIHFKHIRPGLGWFFWDEMDDDVMIGNRCNWFEHWLSGRHRQPMLAAAFNSPTWVDPRSLLGEAEMVEPRGARWPIHRSVNGPRFLRLWDAVSITQNVMSDCFERAGSVDMLGHTDYELGYPRRTLTRARGFSYDLVPQPWELYYNHRYLADWQNTALKMYHHRRCYPPIPEYRTPWVPGEHYRWWLVLMSAALFRVYPLYLVNLLKITTGYSPAQRGSHHYQTLVSASPLQVETPQGSKAKQTSLWGVYKSVDPRITDGDSYNHNQNVFLPALRKRWNQCRPTRVQMRLRYHRLHSYYQPPLYQYWPPNTADISGWHRKTLQRTFLHYRRYRRQHRPRPHQPATATVADGRHQRLVRRGRYYRYKFVWIKQRRRYHRQRFSSLGITTYARPCQTGQIWCHQSNDGLLSSPPITVGSKHSLVSSVSYLLRYQTDRLTTSGGGRTLTTGLLVKPSATSLDTKINHANLLVKPAPPVAPLQVINWRHHQTKQNNRVRNQPRFDDIFMLTQPRFLRKPNFGQRLWSNKNSIFQKSQSQHGTSRVVPLVMSQTVSLDLRYQRELRLTRYRQVLSGVTAGSTGLTVHGVPSFTPTVEPHLTNPGYTTEIFDEDVDEEEQLGENHSDEEEELSPDMECIVETADHLSYLNTPATATIVLPTTVGRRLTMYARLGGLPFSVYQFSAPATYLGLPEWASSIRWSPAGHEHPGYQNVNLVGFSLNRVTRHLQRPSLKIAFTNKSVRRFRYLDDHAFTGQKPLRRPRTVQHRPRATYQKTTHYPVRKIELIDYVTGRPTRQAHHLLDHNYRWGWGVCYEATSADFDWLNDDLETLSFGSLTGYATQYQLQNLGDYVEGYYRPTITGGLPFGLVAPVGGYLVGETTGTGGTTVVDHSVEHILLDLIGSVRYEPFAMSHLWIDRYAHFENTPRELHHPTDIGDHTEELWPTPGSDLPSWLVAAATAGVSVGSPAARDRILRGDPRVATPVEWVRNHRRGAPSFLQLEIRRRWYRWLPAGKKWVARKSYLARPSRYRWWLDRWGSPVLPRKRRETTLWAPPTEAALHRSNLDRTYHLRVWALTEIYSQPHGGRRQQW